jgi:hypothetical protein
MHKDEKKCFVCGTPVFEGKNSREVNLARFRMVVDIMFYSCLVLTVASLVFDTHFKTAMTAAAALVLRLVRQSAGEMSESKS